MDLYKIILVGSSSTGKTAMSIIFTDENLDIYRFNEKTIPTTIGVDFSCKIVEIDGKIVKLQIWDTAGQEKYRSLSSIYFRGSHGIMLVYDVNNRQTVDEIDNFYKEVKKFSFAPSLLLVGAKADELNERKREVSYEEGQNKATLLGCKFIETSSFQKKNINEAFYMLAKECHNIKQKENSESLLLLDKKSSKKKHLRCC